MKRSLAVVSRGKSGNLKLTSQEGRNHQASPLPVSIVDLKIKKTNCDDRNILILHAINFYNGLSMK
jgi:hypothetical protein